MLASGKGCRDFCAVSEDLSSTISGAIESDSDVYSPVPIANAHQNIVTLHSIQSN